MQDLFHHLSKLDPDPDSSRQLHNTGEERRIFFEGIINYLPKPILVIHPKPQLCSMKTLNISYITSEEAGCITQYRRYHPRQNKSVF